MNIPTELIFSPVKGGAFESTGRYSGQWWRARELLAEWHRDKAGEVIITWRSPSAQQEHVRGCCDVLNESGHKGGHNVLAGVLQRYWLSVGNENIRPPLQETATNATDPPVRK